MRSTKTESLVHNILGSRRGFVIGEIHLQQAPIEFMLKHMDIFKKQGVQHIVTEAFYDVLQKDLDLFHQSGVMPPALESRVRELDYLIHLGHMEPSAVYEEFREGLPTMNDVAFMKQASEHPFSYHSLLRNAQANGIRIVAGDSKELSVSGSRGRLTKFNTHVTSLCEALEGKFIVHTGAGHAGRCNKVAGINEMLHIPSLLVLDGSQPNPSVFKGGLLVAKETMAEVSGAYEWVVHGAPDISNRPTRTIAENLLNSAHILNPADNSLEACYYEPMKLQATTPINIKDAPRKPGIMNWFKELPSGGKATVTLGTLAAVGTAAFFAQKALSGKQDDRRQL